MKKVYFAGKVSVHGFRQELMGENIMSKGCGTITTIDNGQLIYGGCDAIDDAEKQDFNEYGRNEAHLLTVADEGSDNQTWVFKSDDVINMQCRRHFESALSPQDVVKRCFQQIDNCDAVYAYIDSPDCYGTLVELGYANAKRKPIYLVFSESFTVQEQEDINRFYSEFWFIRNLETVKNIVIHKSEDKIPFPDELLYFEPKYSVKDILKKIKRTTHNEDELKTLGMMISKEYQQKKGEKPYKKNMQNNGVEVAVNQYSEQDIHWIEEILKQHTKPDYSGVLVEFVNCLSEYCHLQQLKEDFTDSDLHKILKDILNEVSLMSSDIKTVKDKLSQIESDYGDLVNSNDLYDRFEMLRQFFK